MPSSTELIQSEYSDEDYHYMQRCFQLAEKAASLGEVPIGAVIVLDNKIIGEGFNQPIGLHDPTAHAEIQAIRAASSSVGNYRLPETSLYVNIEPCSMCAGAIIHARIKRLIFGAQESKAGAVISKSNLLDSEYINHRVIYSSGCMSEESSQLMKQFFRSRRKNKIP